MRLYSELFLPGGAGISRIEKADAKAYLQEQGWEDEEASRALDERLLSQAQAASQSLALLCLRCRVSAAVAMRLQVMHLKHCEQHELELQDMAACVLDDDGELVFRQKTRQDDGRVSERRLPFIWSTIKEISDREIQPFAADILRSYEPSRCALPTWAETRLQGHRELKQYLRSCGLLLISPWALLADTSPKRIKEAWAQYGEGGMTSQQAADLHASYLQAYWPAKEAYKYKTGKSSGWIPDSSFLLSLSPPQQSDRALRQIDQSIRRLLAIRPRNFGEGEEAAIADPSSLKEIADEAADEFNSADLRSLINQALQTAAQSHIKAAIDNDKGKWQRDSNRQRAWQLYSEGIGQREIAEQCQHQQGWVSKLLKEKTLSHAIALDAAMELIRRPAFQSVQIDPSGAERMVEALKNHLINPEQEGDVPPLRRWIRSYLPQP